MYEGRKGIHRAAGFTLIEILVVVSIILIVFGFALPLLAGVGLRRWLKRKRA